MLKGKTALVTGSTSGIGLGIAKVLATRGAKIVLNGFGDVDGAQRELRDIATEVGYHPADMSKPEQIADLLAYAERTVGAVDILVNNAGIQHVANVEDFPVEKWDAIIAINLSSAFHTTRLALPGMKARRWGRILNIASVHGLVASAAKSAYVASKHGLIGFTKAVALEAATTGVTVNAICPGWVLTPLCNCRSMRAPPRMASMAKKPSAACWPRSSPRCSSRRRRSSVSWRCSCALRQPTTSAAQRSTSTAAGSRNSRRAAFTSSFVPRR
jgi:3-hydroxybutyrate dehydrogenase